MNVDFGFLCKQHIFYYLVQIVEFVLADLDRVLFLNALGDQLVQNAGITQLRLEILQALVVLDVRTGDHEFTVDAPWLERILAGTNVEDYESLQYFQTQLGDSGILDELVAQGVEEEDTIKIGEYEFDYLY